MSWLLPGPCARTGIRTQELSYDYKAVQLAYAAYCKRRDSGYKRRQASKLEAVWAAAIIAQIHELPSLSL